VALATESLPNDLVTVPEAARQLGVHPESLYRLIRSGEFPPAIHVGSRIRVSVPRLERFKHGEVTP
jgi:excisionase family DNA binding protein